MEDRDEEWKGLRVPALDMEYMDHWNSWHEGLSIFNFFEGAGELGAHVMCDFMTTDHAGTSSAIPQGLHKVNKDCKRKAEDQPDTAPRSRALTKSGLKMTESDEVPTRRAPVKQGFKMPDSDNVPLRGSLDKLQDSTEASFEAKFEKARQKLQDSYQRANKRSISKLMDYRSLPTPAQGSCQRIRKRITRNPNSLKTASMF